MTPTEVTAFETRLADDNETFTAQEVRDYVEWHERALSDDAYHQARIANALAISQDTNKQIVASVKTLETLFETYQPPTLIVFGGM